MEYSKIQEPVEGRDRHSFATKRFAYYLMQTAFVIAVFSCFCVLYVQQERLQARLHQQDIHVQAIKQLFISAAVDRDEDGVFIYFGDTALDVLQQLKWMKVEEGGDFLEINGEKSNLERNKRVATNTSKPRRRQFEALGGFGPPQPVCEHPATHMTAPSKRRVPHRPGSSAIFFEWSPSSIFSKPECQIRPYNIPKMNYLSSDNSYQYLEINKTGFYFVYSQLRYDDREGEFINNGHETVLTRTHDVDEKEEKVLMSSYTDQTSHHRSSYCCRADDSKPVGLDTNYHGGVFLLNQGDLIGVRPLSNSNSGHPGIFLQSPETSFFGAILIQKFADEGVYPDNTVG